jgi:hypothetical protein
MNILLDKFKILGKFTILDKFEILDKFKILGKFKILDKFKILVVGKCRDDGGVEEQGEQIVIDWCLGKASRAGGKFDHSSSQNKGKIDSHISIRLYAKPS